MNYKAGKRHTPLPSLIIRSNRGFYGRINVCVQNYCVETGMRFILHSGHDPGLDSLICGCIEHVQTF